MSGASGELAILPPGTKAVTTVDLREDARGVRVPRGAVGTVLKSPTDASHCYWVRLVEGGELLLRRAEIVTLARCQDRELHDTPAAQSLFERVILATSRRPSACWRSRVPC